MREHLRKCGIHVFRKQIKAGGNGNIICFFARSIKNVECGVQRPVQIPGHCFVGTRNKTCEFIAADASADTAFADGILQKLSDKADGEVPFFMPVQMSFVFTLTVPKESLGPQRKILSFYKVLSVNSELKHFLDNCNYFLSTSCLPSMRISII